MGKPGHQQVVILASAGRRTQGTETSKYLEEEKSTEIPLVAASEGGRAWHDLANILVEWSGKSDLRG